MPLNLGSTAITALKLGSTNVSKVMLGTVQVWPAVVTPPAVVLWTPADLGADRVWGWFKPEASTLSVSVGKVSEWRSMIGANLLQNLNAATQPTLTAGVSVDCLASGQVMASPSRGFATSGSRAVAMVAQFNNIGNTIGIDIDKGWQTGFFSQHKPIESIVVALGPGSARLEAANAALNANIKYMSIGRMSTSQVITKVNGGVETAKDSAMPAVGPVDSGVTLNHLIKEDPVGTHYEMMGRYFEIVICYGAVLTALEVSQLEGYLAHSNGIANLLPGDHPYKAAPPTK